jgi:ribosomal protein S18 acetylase RimI-like enzyme
MTNDRDVTLARAEPADMDLVAALSIEAYAPYIPIMGAKPLPITEPYGPRIERGEVWLLRVGGELAGVLVLELHPDHAMLYSVAVMPGRQGEGHGGRLLRLAEAQARAAGLGEIRLYTNALMSRNVALYSALGYRETGRRPHPRLRDNTLVDMTKHLDAAA